ACRGNVQGDVEVRHVGGSAGAEEPVRLDDGRVLAHQHFGVKSCTELRGVVWLVEHNRQRIEHEAVLEAVVQPPDDSGAASAPISGKSSPTPPTSGATRWPPTTNAVTL